MFRRERHNGVDRVVRYQLRRTYPNPPLQEWEGDGVLMNGEADPDAHWKEEDRVQWRSGFPSEDQD